jgi:hypothetical protein
MMRVAEEACQLPQKKTIKTCQRKIKTFLQGKFFGNLLFSRNLTESRREKNVALFRAL